jgi:tape measure domain-containing protein
MPNVGTISVGMTLSAVKFFQGIDAARKQLKSFNKEAGAMAVASANITATGLTGVLLGITTGAVGVGLAAVSAAADMETLQISFTNLTGSASAANSVLRDLEDFGAKTPFQFNDLTRATQTLMTFGFEAEDSVKIIKQLGDVSAASTMPIAESLERVTRAIGVMRAKGRVTGEEMQRLAEAGIPAWNALAKSMGVTVPKAMKQVEEGMVSASKGVNAILDLAADPKFAGLMAKQAQTVKGLWSTLLDQIDAMMRHLGARIISAFDIKGTIGQITTFFSNLDGSLDKFMPLLRIVGALFQGIRDYAFAIGNAILSWSANKMNMLFGGLDPETMRQWAISVIDTLLQKVNQFVNAVRIGGGYLLRMFAGLAAMASHMTAVTNMTKDPGIKAETDALMRTARVMSEFANGLIEPGLNKDADALTRIANAARNVPFLKLKEQLMGYSGVFAGAVGVLAAFGGQTAKFANPFVKVNDEIAATVNLAFKLGEAFGIVTNKAAGFKLKEIGNPALLAKFGEEFLNPIEKFEKRIKEVNQVAAMGWLGQVQGGRGLAAGLADLEKSVFGTGTKYAGAVLAGSAADLSGTLADQSQRERSDMAPAERLRTAIEAGNKIADAELKVTQQLLDVFLDLQQNDPLGVLQ